MHDPNPNQLARSDSAARAARWLLAIGFAALTVAGCWLLYATPAAAWLRAVLAGG